MWPKTCSLRGRLDGCSNGAANLQGDTRNLQENVRGLAGTLREARMMMSCASLRPQYRMGELIAKGGMASVFEAHDEYGVVVAAKVPHRAMMASEVAVERFMRESALLCSLRSPFIVRGLGVSRTADDRPMLIMERLHGEDLATTLQQSGPLPLERAVRAIIDTCTALAALHARAVVHRDLKPSNVYVTQAPDGLGPAMLLDLGVVKSMSAKPAEESVTVAGCVVGSPPYMAPEQMLGQDNLDHRADIWSVGVLLYELLSGRVPFEGNNIMHVLSRALFNAKPRLSELRGDVPASVESVVDRCLRPDPTARFGCALEVAHALLPALPPSLQRRAAVSLASCAAERLSGT